jgi:protein transport protein SEC24
LSGIPKSQTPNYSNHQIQCYDPSQRPEFHYPTLEYIAPGEYMLRPPQPPLYLFLFDVGTTAVDTGYLHTFSEQLLLNLDLLPGEERALIGFIGVDSAMHFFQFGSETKPPRQLVMSDVEGDMGQGGGGGANGADGIASFFPSYDGLVVPLKKYKEVSWGLSFLFF